MFRCSADNRISLSSSSKALFICLISGIKDFRTRLSISLSISCVKRGFAASISQSVIPSAYMSDFCVTVSPYAASGERYEYFPFINPGMVVLNCSFDFTSPKSVILTFPSGARRILGGLISRCTRLSCCPLLSVLV